MTKLTQTAAFAEIKALGFTVRKTQFCDYRVADPTIADLDRREACAYYCSDLAEALDQARYWASLKAQAPQPQPIADRDLCPDRAPDCSTPSPDAIAQLVAAAKAARFALESACYLQGLRALAPSALQLTEALEAFETVEASAEAHMRAAALSGRPDLAA